MIEPQEFTAFIAHVPNDLEYSRLELVDELKNQGVKVRDPSNNAELTKELMAKADVCIHLFDGSDDHGVYEQLDWSCTQAQRQILWLSAKIKEVDSEPQNRKIWALKECEGNFNFIHSHNPCGDIVGEVKKLKAARNRKRSNGIFVTFHEVDQGHVKDLFDYLRSRNVKTLLDKHEFVQPIMNRFDEIVGESSAIIVLYGQVGDRWVEQRLNAAVNFGVSGSCSLDVLGVYLAPPPPEAKRERIHLPLHLKPIWMNNTGGFNPGTLEELFSILGPEARA